MVHIINAYIRSFTNVFGTGTSFWHRLHAWLQMIFVAGMGITGEAAFATDPHHDTGRVFISIFLLSRLLYVASYSKAYVSMPKFATNISLRTSATILSSIPWFASIFLDRKYRIPLWWIGLVADFVSRFLVYALRYFFGGKYRLAFNIEHHWERFGLFTMIMLGKAFGMAR